VAANSTSRQVRVFIPCGVTLGVMFLTVASGSPLAAMLMFVHGTFPLLAALGYAAARLAAVRGAAAPGPVIAVALTAVGLWPLIPRASARREVEQHQRAP
jgi:sulfite exporter TauE/SafE